MSRDGPSRIPPPAEELFDVLAEQFEDAKEGFSREAAIEHLSAEGFEERVIEHAIERLLLRGYLYEVDDTLFITPTDV